MKNQSLFLMLAVGFLLFNNGFAKAQQLEWAIGVGGENSESVRGMCIDQEGNIIISVAYSKSTRPNPSDTSLIFISPAPNQAGGFIAKFDPQGSFIWAVNLLETSDVVCDSNGNIYVCGSFVQAFDLDPSADSMFLYPFNPQNGGDLYLAKYNGNGDLIWAFMLGSIENGEDVLDLVLDNENNLALVGFTAAGSSDDSLFWFHPSQLEPTLLPGGPEDIILAKYDTAGNFLWGFGIGGDGFNEGKAITVDASCNVYITGKINKNGDFDPGPGSATWISDNGALPFIAKYSKNGELVWSKIISCAIGYGRDIHCDINGNVYLTGMYYYWIKPNNTTLFSTMASWSEIYLFKYDSLGNYLWGFYIEEPDKSDSGEELTSDSQGNVYLSGEFHNTANFSTVPQGAVLSASNGPVFIAKYSSAGENIWAINSYTTEVKELIHTGFLFFAGIFEFTVDFDPGDGVYILENHGFRDCVIAKYETTLNISELFSSASFTVFPNPFHEKIGVWFQVENPYSKGTGKIWVTNAFGSKVYGYTGVLGEHHEIDLGNCPAGIYIVSHLSNDRITNEKIIKY